MRGTLILSTSTILLSGIIPAYAGNTCSRIVDASAIKDHPRLCGEHTMSCLQLIKKLGSSPLMRGTHGFRHMMQMGVRIIPAYAGNTHQAHQ